MRVYRIVTPTALRQVHNPALIHRQNLTKLARDDDRMTVPQLCAVFKRTLDQLVIYPEVLIST
ncbi:hypothetical protein J6590_055122 [Homalodisca vitripennis]|nr:hypothetical protein J6590_055122 [Homalodisca vitripennis]